MGFHVGKYTVRPMGCCYGVGGNLPLMMGSKPPVSVDNQISSFLMGWLRRMMASAEPARVECTRNLVGEEILREIPVPSPSTFQVQTGLSIGFGLLSESKDAFLLGPV